MSEFWKWVSSAISVGAVGAAIAFAFSVYQFVTIRKREAEEREFHKYHELIERLVSPDQSGKVFEDRQMAIVFELRNFPRYYECTYRILRHLQLTWSETSPKTVALHNEITLTRIHIEKRLGRKLARYHDWPKVLER